jgi:hypothetical protein
MIHLFFFPCFFFLDLDISELRTGEITNGGSALIEWRSALHIMSLTLVADIILSF